jgi:hypothetical protein
VFELTRSRPAGAIGPSYRLRRRERGHPDRGWKRQSLRTAESSADHSVETVFEISNIPSPAPPTPTPMATPTPTASTAILATAPAILNSRHRRCDPNQQAYKSDAVIFLRQPINDETSSKARISHITTEKVVQAWTAYTAYVPESPFNRTSLPSANLKSPAS